MKSVDRAMRHRVLAVALTLAGCLSATPADAQFFAPPTERSTRPLFGSGSAKNEQSLDVHVSTFGAYDDNVVPFDDQGSTSTTTHAGGFSGVSTSTTYERRFQYAEIGLSERSAFRYYPSLGDLAGLQHLGKAGVRVGRGGTRLDVAQTLGYTPYITFLNAPELFESGPGVPPALTVDQSVSRFEGRVYGTAVDFAQAFGPRTELRFTALTNTTDYLGHDAKQRNDLVRARLTRKIARGIGIVGGYGVERGGYTQTSISGRTTRLQVLDVGIEYDRSLSISRRTTIQFATGTAIVDDYNGGRELRLTGNLHLSRDIGRTWRATAAYSRGAGFMDGLQLPVFADSVAVSVGGAIGRRMELRFGGAYSQGEIGVTTSNNQESFTTSARMRIALSRRLAFSSEYVTYRYAFGESVVLPSGVPSGLERQGLRFGFDLWLPLVR